MNKSWVVVAVSVAWAGIAWAGGGVKEKGRDARQLPEVVVTSGRVDEVKQEVTANVTVVDEEEIRRSSADTLGEILAEQATGPIRRYPGALTSIGLRGVRTETHGNDLRGHVLILLDGRRIGTGNAAKIPARNIERIEIVRGPAAVQYGSAAMGGVVNVITKQGQGEPGLAVEALYGSDSTWEGGLSLSGAGAGLDGAVTVSVRTEDDYATGEGDTYANTGLDRRDALSLNLGYTPVPGHRIGLVTVRTEIDHAGSPSYLSQNDLDDYTDGTNRSMDLSYEGRVLEDLLSWKVRYFEGRDRSTWVDPVESNPDFFDDGVPSQRNTEFQGTQVQVSLDEDLFLLTAGFDWVDYEIENTWLPRKTRYENPSGFLLGKLRLLDRRLILNGGLRYDEYEVEVEDPVGRTETDDQRTPRAGAAFVIMEGLKLRANYGEAFVMPGADQLAANYVAFGRRQIGNPDLKPEASWTLDAGVDLARGAMEASLSWFTTRYEDMIQAVATAAGDSTWENVGRASVEGFEGTFSYDLGAWFGWSWEVRPEIRAAWLTRCENEVTAEDLLHVSDLHLAAGLAVADPGDFFARIQVSYWGPQRVEDWESGRFPVPVVEKGGAAVVNLTADKTLVRSEKSGNLSARFEAENLLDHHYDHAKGYPMPGARFYGGLVWRF